MPALDLRSILFLAGAMGVLMSGMLALLRYTYPRSIRGIGLWALGPLLCFLSAAIATAPGSLNYELKVVLGNALVLLGMGVFYFGSQHFLGIATPYRQWAAAFVLATLVTSWWVVWSPDYAMRVGVTNLMMAFIMGKHGLLLWSHRRANFFAGLTAGLLFIETVILLSRVAQIAMEAGPPACLPPPPHSWCT